MFTGIITDTAAVRAEPGRGGLKMRIKKPSGWTDLSPGESVAVDGVCLTVSNLLPDEFECFVMPETLARTLFGQRVPERVNLERSLLLKDRFGGHFVQGHVDEVGWVIKLERAGADSRLAVRIRPTDRKYVVRKGSISVNGVSLTVAGVSENSFEVALIPYTLEHTTLGLLRPEGAVNLEFDVLGKYVLNSLKFKRSVKRPARAAS